MSITIELANDIAKELGLDIQFIALENEVGVVEGDKLTRVSSALAYYASKNIRGSLSTMFTHAGKTIRTSDGKIVSTSLDRGDARTGWCRATNNGHAVWCDDQHLSKVTREIVGDICIETIEVNGVETPYRYYFDRCHYTPAEWERFNVLPPYVPRGQEFPALITLPDGKQVQCANMHNVPRVNIPIVWAIKNGLTPKPGTLSEERLCAWHKANADIVRWNDAHAKLAAGRFDLGFGEFPVDKATAGLIAQMLYAKRPHGSPDTLRWQDFE